MKYVAPSRCWGITNTAILKNGYAQNYDPWDRSSLYSIIQDSPEDWSKESGTMHACVLFSQLLHHGESTVATHTALLHREKKALNHQ